MAWQRWNTSSHIFEYSTDNGVNWLPLPVNAGAQFWESPVPLVGGGAGVSLLGTGGVGRYLRQNAPGALIDVVRPSWDEIAKDPAFNSSLLPYALMNGWDIKLINDTGTKNDYDLGITGNTLFLCNNASLLTINGIKGGRGGIMIGFVGYNAEVDFAFNNGSSSAGNKLLNQVTSGITPIAQTGSIFYTYDNQLGGGGANAWRMIHHLQGKPITYTPTYGANGSMTFTGVTADTIFYTIKSRELFMSWYNVSGTIGGTVNNTITIGYPNSYIAENLTGIQAQLALGLVNDAGAGNQVAFFNVAAGGTSIAVIKVGSANYTLGTCKTFGQITLMIQ